VSPPIPVLPAYGEASLDAVIPGLLAARGARPAWFPDGLGRARQVVLLVLDGLGWRQLLDRVALAPTLAGLTGGPITSVAPTTTAAALTSIAVGAAPAQHGIVGYRMAVTGPSGPEVLNVLRWRTPSGDAREQHPPRQLQRLVPFGGQAVPVISRGEFNGSGFTEAHLGGARLVGWSVASSITVEVRRLLAGGEPLVYAYYDGIDKVAHIYGFGEHYDAELAAVDRLVADLLAVLPPGAALAVTADHGQVDVGSRAVPLGADVMAETAMVSGEGRFRWLHAHPGRADALLKAAEAAYGTEAWVLTEAQVEADRWLGGPLPPEVRTRVGDVAVVPYEPVAYLDPADAGETRLVCRHGSLTADEMLVPLVAHVG
jgi:hypothetical protein